MSKGVVLLSGGMDSLVTAAIAVQECSETYFLHINYGQRTEAREIDSFWKLVNHYQPTNSLICNLDFLEEIGSSSLTDRAMKIPVVKKEGQMKKEEIPNTYVPFRNALMMSFAVSWAETIGADRIYIGAVEEDSSGYPDTREVFFKAFNEMVKLGTKNSIPIEIITPLLHKSKKEIVLLGNALDAPFEDSWSCYSNNDKACGVCASCYLRLKAFKEAGLIDPIEYERK